MDPVTLIAAALAAGSLAGAQGAASNAVTDAYASLKKLIARRFAGNTAATAALEKHERKPDAWKAALEDELRESGAAEDGELIEHAQALMALVDEQGACQGKYVVSIVGSSGTQVGDANVQANYFTHRPHEWPLK